MGYVDEVPLGSEKCPCCKCILNITVQMKGDYPSAVVLAKQLEDSGYEFGGAFLNG